MRKVQVEVDARRKVMNLAPEIQQGEIESAVELFEALADGFELDKTTTPQKDI